jgi:hypothetical protein
MSVEKPREDGAVVRTGIDVTAEPSRTFERLVEELVVALERQGILFELEPRRGEKWSSVFWSC